MKRFKNLLCVVDASSASKTVLERACTLAENNQARVTVISVGERIRTSAGMWEGGPTSSDLQDALDTAKTNALDTLIAPYRERIDLDARVLVGTAFIEIIREVLRNGHDLVIKNAESVAWLEKMIASDDMHLLRKCPCPVWLVKPGAPKSYRCILAAVDVDEEYPAEELKLRKALNRQILEMAVSLALSDFAELHTVAAWRAVGESAMRGAFLHTPEDKIATYLEQVRSAHEASLDRLMDQVTGDIGQEALGYLKPQAHLVKGLPEREIPKLAEQIEADIVVMGTVARTGVAGFIMGNTAESILNQLGCSVLAVKPPGFVTPVTLQE